MFSKLNRHILLLIILGGALILCTRETKIEPDEIILARIAKKTISLNEFLRRAEYAPRPKYCRGNTGIHKKIVLNSLIAEKMLALEAGENNELARNKHFQRYIQGRKEQAMRQWLYHEEAVSKVRLDSSEIKKVYQVAGRKYKVYFFTINDDSIAQEVKRKLHEQGISFEQVFRELDELDSLHEKEIEFNSREHDVIHNALFSKKLKANEVIGPLKVESNLYLVMKVKGWTNRVALTEKDIQQRWNDVKVRLTDQKALRIYENFVAKIMKGKKIEFVPPIFRKLVNLIGPLYFELGEKRNEIFLSMALDKKLDNPEFLNLHKGIEEIRNEPFFQIDGEIWTVGDFEIELEKHPLVFRKKKMNENEFTKQFKLAIADMIRDKYLAQEAYKRGYDEINVVKRNAEMWKDAFLAYYQKRKYLEKINYDKENEVKVITKYLNPYINELQVKYNDIIEINIEAFEKVNLTRIDMFATQYNVPFPVVVPTFPQVITDHKLDYGRRMEN